MSKFSEKLSKSETPTDQEWAEHLVEAHRVAPSMTPKAFASHVSKDGLNSYQYLANTLKTRTKEIDLVIDLACGDGFLAQYIMPHLRETGRIIGVDMSEDELAVARQSVKNHSVSFVCCEASALPTANRSVDFILCHLAFMLMLPVEPVISELKRTLKPHGVFAAVISNPKATQGLLSEIQKIIFSTLTENFPMIKDIKSGDPRVASLVGLKELFHKDSWKTPEVSDFEVTVRTSAEGIWEFMKNTYFIGMLPEAAKKRLRATLIAFVRTKLDVNKEVSFEFPFQLISVTYL